MKQAWLGMLFGIFLAFITGEIFFSVLSNSRIAEIKRLNEIKEDEGWWVAGDLFMPPGERNAYRGPEADPTLLLRKNPDLGSSIRPNLRAVPALLKRGGQIIYEATYSTGRFGWRKNPVNPEASSTAIFLGNSMIFGYGLHEEESLPAAFSRKSGMHALNFGVPGWGAAQVLRMLELEMEKKPLSPYRPKSVYLLVSPAWLREPDAGSPVYKFGEGSPKFSGTHETESDGLSLRACAWSALCEAIHHFWRPPLSGTPEVSPEHSKQIAALISRIEDLLKQRYGPLRFVVLSWSAERDASMRLLEGDIEERGVHLLKLRSFLPGFPENGYGFLYDGHPTRKAVEEIAEFLATDG